MHLESVMYVATEPNQTEISKENREAALAALEAKKAEIEAQIAEKTKSMRSYLKKINSEIDDLKKGDE